MNKYLPIISKRKKDNSNYKQCPNCLRYFGVERGLNQHQKGGSRCQRAAEHKLDVQDVEMIRKYPGKYKGPIFQSVIRGFKLVRKN